MSVPTVSELELLQQSRDARTDVQLVVNRCLFSCCGRGWRAREGYEQTYYGFVSQLDEVGFVLTSRGLGTVSYVMRAAFDDVLDVGAVTL